MFCVGNCLFKVVFLKFYIVLLCLDLFFYCYFVCCGFVCCWGMVFYIWYSFCVGGVVDEWFFGWIVVGFVWMGDFVIEFGLFMIRNFLYKI